MWSYYTKKINMEKNINTIKNKFTETYVNNKWKHGTGESKSGEGSSLYWTENYRNELIEIINKYSIKKILDCSCGDWNWMKLLSDKLVDYTGVDIVEDLIKTNNEKYGNDNVKFICSDMLSFLENTNETYDLIICRHTFEHLPSEYGLNSMLLIKNKCKYFLFSSQDIIKNNEINFDGYVSRNLNLTIEPYNTLLGQPIYRFLDSPLNIDKKVVYNDVYGNLYKSK